MKTYRMRSDHRPLWQVTLPSGAEWEYVEQPRYGWLDREGDAPASFGTFKTNRPLTADELDRFKIEIV